MKMSTQLNDNTTIRELVGRYPETRAVFEKHGIDYCCGGGRTLAAVVSETQVSIAELLAALAAAIETPAGRAAATNWFEAPLHELVDHIIKVHHSYVKEALPRIAGLLRKVLNAHGAQHGDMLRELQLQFSLLEDELTGHMMKEEMILFPYVVAAEAQRQGDGPQPSACFGTVRNPIRQMEAEHEVAGEALRQIRKVTCGFVPPSDACPTFRALYEELEQFEEDLHEHVHLENNILFPRAIEAESTDRMCHRLTPGGSPEKNRRGAHIATS
jgi:regulator of cell morphogenesis and NO signaling